jgi:hypothetical protein
MSFEDLKLALSGLNECLRALFALLARVANTAPIRDPITIPPIAAANTAPEGLAMFDSEIDDWVERVDSILLYG